MSRTEVQDTLREMWETRPARPRDDRQVAGVAAAIARRYDIDPVLVRVGFVVAAFSGIGAALYIAGWILLPEEPARPGQPAAQKPRNIVVVGFAIAAAVTIGTFFGGNGPDVVLPLLAVAVLLYLLHRSRSHRAVGGTTTAADVAGMSAASTSVPTADSGAPGTTAAASPAAGADAVTVPTPAPAPAPTPPAWDPLGAAPFAWDLPEPSPAPPSPPPRRLPVTPVTLGLALLAGGVTAVIMLLAGVLTLANLPVLMGVVLAVIGAGMVIGSFLRAGRGLIPFALLLSVLTYAAVAAPLDRWQGNGFGDLRAAPTSVAELQPSYHRTTGDVDIDLRNLDLTATPGGNTSPVRTSVSVGAGDVDIWVPANADVSFTGSAGIGDVRFGDDSRSGPGAHLEVTDDLGADGVAGDRPLVLSVELGAGDVEVHRG